MVEAILGARGRRALLSGATCVALVASITAVLHPVPARAQATPAVLVTSAVNPSPVGPGGLGVADLLVENQGEGGSGLPFQLVITSPPGVTVEGITTRGLRTWACTTAGTEATCTLVDAETGTPVPLDGTDLVGGHLTVALDGSVDVTAGLTIGVAATAPGDGTAPDLTGAATDISFPPLPGGQALAVDVVDDFAGVLVAGRRVTVSTEIRNLGPAGLGHPGAPTLVSGILPPGATYVSSGGPGWACFADGSGGVLCRGDGPTQPAGARLPALEVSFDAPSGLTPEGEPLTWTRRVSVTPSPPGAGITVETPFTAAVVPPPQPLTALETRGATPASLEAPGTVEVALTVSGTNLANPFQEVVLAAPELPPGFEFAGLASDDPWSCIPIVDLVRCARNADFGGQSASDVVVTLNVTPAAPPGPASILFAVAATDEPLDETSDNGAFVVVQVHETPPPGAALRLWQYDGTGGVAPTDGSPYRLTPGAPGPIGLDGLNDGSAPVPAGSEFVLAATFPLGSGVTASTDRGAPDWACSTDSSGAATELECLITLAEAVVLDAALPRLRLDVTLPAGLAPGELAVPATLESAGLGLASELEIPLVVAGPLAGRADDDVAVEAEVVRTPRIGGRSGLLRIALTNIGVVPLLRADIGVDLPPGVRVAGRFPPGCNARQGRWAGFDMVCKAAKGAAPGQTIPALVVEVVASAGTGGLVRFVVDPWADGYADIEVALDLQVLPALVARATATPSTVHNQPPSLPQPSVLLDGRGSDAVGATHTWRQMPVAGEPLVTLDGTAAPGDPLEAATATFEAPVVGATTVLHFALDVADGVGVSTATVEVVVEPLPVGGGGAPTGWEDQQPLAAHVPNAARFSAGGPRIAFSGEDWWQWSRDPAVELNKLGAGTPVLGSRMTLLDNGDFAFLEPTNPPDSEEVSHQWLLCDRTSDHPYDPATCDVIGTGDSVVPAVARIAVLRMTVRGERGGTLLETVRDFFLGDVNVDTSTPVSLSPPTISGGMAVGDLLTGHPGSWTIELDLAFQWLRCSAADAATCTEIAGETASTHTVALDDESQFLRLRVTSSGVDPGGDGVAFSDFFGPIDEVGALAVGTDLAGGTASVPNSASLTIHGFATGGVPPYSFEWVQTSGPGVIASPSFGPDLSFRVPAKGIADVGFELTATDAVGQTDTTAVTVTYGAVAVSSTLCDIVAQVQAAGGGPVTISLGTAIVLSFTGATLSGGKCSGGSSIDVTGATVDLFGWMQVSGVTLHIDSGGVDLDGGTLTVPGDPVLGAMGFRLVSSGLHIPFNAALAEFHIAGAVIADSLPFLNLPGGWEAAARFGFASGAGGQEIDFEAVAWDGTAGPVAPAFDDLPEPPAGFPQLSLQGAAATDRSFSFALNTTDLVVIAGVALDFAGSVARDGAGVFGVTAEASLAGPVALAPGVTLESASLSWDGSVFSGGGSLSVTANGATVLIDVTFDFTDARNWAASLSIDVGGTWTPVSGFSLTDLTVVGTIARDGGATAIDLEVGAADVAIGPDLVFSDLLFGLHVDCGATCDPVMMLSGQATVSVADPSTTVDFAGSLDLGSGDFSLEAAIAELRPVEGLVVHSLVLAMTGGGGALTELSLEGSATVLGLPVEVVVTFSDDGFFLSISLGTWQPSSGAPTFQGARIVYTNFDTTVDVGPETVEVPADTVFVTATTGAPTWFANLIGFNPGTLTVAGQISLATGDFDVELSFALPAGTQLFSVGGVSLDVGQVVFSLGSVGGLITTGIGADGTLNLPPFEAAAAGSAIPVGLNATFQPGPTGGLSGAITVVGDWVDAFGLPGLVVANMSVGLFVGATTQLSFEGDVTLPPAWVSPIGIAPGTPIGLLASVGGPNSCFGIEIGEPGGSAPVVDVGNAGVLTARHLSLVVAPTGCTVGANVLAPGLSLLFDGSVLGVNVAINATLRPVPFELDATVVIGGITVDGFHLEGAELHVLLNATTQEISFQAQATIFGATATVAGAFSRSPTGTVVDLMGSFSAPDLGGFALDDLTVTVHVEQGPGSLVVDIGASVDVTILGAPQHVEFAFTLVNGRVVEASGSAAVLIPIDRLTISGTGQFEFRQGEFPTISITGTVDVDGHQLTQVSALLTGGGLSIEAKLGTGLGFSSPPMLSGVIAWASDGTTAIMIKNQNGDLVAASPGDFRFAATNVGLGVSGYHVFVDVTIGFVGGVFWAELEASFNIEGTAIELGGSFASNGDFTVHGSAALRILEISLPSGSFEISRTGGTFEVRGDITWSIPNLSTVRFQGSFSRNSTRGILFDLRGTAAVHPGGYRFGTGEFRMFRTMTASGIRANADVNVPGLARATASLVISAHETLEFNVDLALTGNIGSALGRPTVAVRYYNGPELVVTGWAWQSFSIWGFTFSAFLPEYDVVDVDRLSMSASLHNVLKLPVDVSVSGRINRSSSGSHSFALDVSASFHHGDRASIGFCTAWYSADADFHGSITGSDSTLQIKIEASVSGSAGCGLASFSVGIDVEFSYTRPSTVSLKVWIDLSIWRPRVI